MPPARSAAVIAAPLSHQTDMFAHTRFDVADPAKIATHGLEADEVAERGADASDFGWEFLKIYELTVDEPQTEILIEQGNAFTHAVEHGLHQRMALLSR